MSVDNFKATIWNAALLVRFAATEVLAATMNRDYEGDAQKGNKVKITGISTPKVVDYKTGGSKGPRTIDYEQLSDAQIELDIDQEKAFGFTVDDIDNVQAAGSFGPVMTDSAAALAEDAEEFLGAQLLTGGTPIGRRTVAATAASGAETLVAGWQMFQKNDIGKAVAGTGIAASTKITDVSNDGKTATINNATSAAVNGVTVGTNPTDVTDGDTAYDMVLSLATALDNNRVPRAGRYLGVNGAFGQFLLGADSKLSNVNTSGSPEGLRNAVVGQLLGFTVITTPLINGDLSAPTAVGYHRSASAYVNQINKSEAMRSPDSFADLFRALHVYGGKVARPSAIQTYTPQG